MAIGDLINYYGIIVSHSEGGQTEDGRESFSLLQLKEERGSSAEHTDTESHNIMIGTSSSRVLPCLCRVEKDIHMWLSVQAQNFDKYLGSRLCIAAGCMLG